MQLWNSITKNNLTFNQVNSIILKQDCYAANTNYNCLYFYKNNILYILNHDNKLFTNIPISKLNNLTSSTWMIVLPNDLALSYLRGLNLY